MPVILERWKHDGLEIQVSPSSVRPARAGRFDLSEAALMLSAGETHDQMLPPGEASGLELEYPERLVEPSAWLGHVPFALWLVGALEPRMIVELGVHTGNSYCAFLQAAHALGLDTRCFGVDHWRGDEHAGYYGDEIYREFRSYHDARYGAFSTLLRCSFDDARSYFSDGSIDLLHIDGFHTYEAVTADFTSWLPKLSSRGVALFHDVNVRERGFGIWRFWEELKSRYPHFEFPHSHGLGVAYLGSETLPDPLKMLFAARTDAETEPVRSYFSRLGTSVADRLAVSTLEAELDGTRSTLARQRAQAEAVVAAHEKARERIVAFEVELHAARLETVRANANAASRGKDLETKLDAVTLQAQVQASLARQRMAVAARLQRDLVAANVDKHSYQRELLVAQRDLDAANSDKGALQRELTTANAEKDALQRELRAANAEKDAFQRELLATNSEKQSYQRQLSDILQSRSWRLTGPIRLALIRLRRLLASSREPLGNSRTDATPP